MAKLSFSDFMDEAVPAGAQASQSTNGNPSTPRFSDFVTGQNRAGTGNGWDTPFYQTFISRYQQSMDQGTAKDYFRQANATGIVMDDGTDAVDGRRARVGDVYNEGRFQGNLYDRYDPKVADQIMTPLLLSADEQRHGVTLQQKLQSNRVEREGARSRGDFDAAVEKTKDEWDTQGESDWTKNEDLWAPILGAAGGGAMAGVAGGLFFGPLGAVVGGIGGALVGGIGAYANRDELENMAARGKVQAEMADKEGAGTGSAVRLQTWSQLAGEFANPFKQAVHGAAEVAMGTQGDDESAFYAVDETGQKKRGAGWTALDVGAGFAGAALQFATPAGALAFQGQMLGQIGGKVGTMLLSGGKTFDDRTGTFDNVFTNRENQFDLGSSLAGVADVGIDVLQLGMGRAAMVTAGALGKEGGRLAKLAGMASQNETVAGYRFIKNAAGEVVDHKLAITMMLPSELAQGLGVRASAMLAKGSRSGAISSDDMYRAAMNMANGSNLRRSVLVNAFGEGSEEAVQTAFEAVSHGASATLEEMVEAGLMGAAMGAGMTVGSRVGTRRSRGAMDSDQRMLLQANAMAEGFGREQITAAAWKKMSASEKATLVAVPADVVEAHKLAATKVQERMVHTLLTNQDGVAVERLTDVQHEMVARERDKLNSVIDGTYVISKAQHNIEDHRVVGSINTVADILRRNLAGLVEQAATQADPTAKARLEVSVQAATRLAQEAAAAAERFYVDGVTEPEQQALVSRVNTLLETAYTIPKGASLERVDAAKAATLTFLRNPADNDGSFQGLLPTVSLERSKLRADNYLQVSLGPTQAMGGDFDGDKVTTAARVELDDVAFMNMRTGNNLLGALSGAEVNVMKRSFEEYEIAELSASLRMPSGDAMRSNAEATVKALRDFLESELKLNGVRFGQDVVRDFVRDLKAGNKSAKATLLNRLAREYPAEMRALSEETYSNLWFRLNSKTHQELQNFQFARAAAGTTMAKRGKPAPIPLDSAVGTIRARSAANFSQTLSLEAVGSDMFRKWQKLPYSKYNSPELDSGVEDPTTLQEMTAFYAALSSGKAISDMDTLFAKDDITKTVISQLTTLAAKALPDFNGRQPAMALLANTMVPSIMGNRIGRPITLLQWLLNEAVAAEEQQMRSSGILERDTALQAKYSRLKSLNPGQAFREVFNAFQMRDLLGMDGDVFGANLTVGQWSAAYVDQSDSNRREDARQLRLHASYLAKHQADGRHNLPYLVDDLAGDTPITPFQSTVDALVQAGNTTLTWSPGETRPSNKSSIGKASNQTSDKLRTVIGQLQEAGKNAKIRLEDPKAWEAFFDARPEVGRAYMALIQDSAVDVVFHVDKDDKTHIARWVYGMLAMSPKASEMEYFRQTLLASFIGRTGRLDAETDPRGYHELTDRLHQLMHRLALDERTFQYERFQNELFRADDVDKFMTWVNDHLRENEAPFTAWSRDVSEIDPTATTGGWSKVLEGTATREAISQLETKTSKLVGDLAAEALREEADALTASRLEEAVRNPNSEAAPLLQNLKRALEFARAFRTPLGPTAMQRANIGNLLGAMDNMANKGQVSRLQIQNGYYDAKGDDLKYGTAEEILAASLTAYSTDEAGGDPTLLASEAWDLIDDQGRTIHWDLLTPERFVELWRNPDNQPMLRAIVFPSAYEHTVEGRIDQVFLTDLSLTELVNGDPMNDLLFGNSSHSKNTYLSFVESMAGNQAVQRYVDEYTISQLGSRLNELSSPDEAERLVQEAYKNLAEILQELGELARVEFDVKDDTTGVTNTVNAVDALQDLMRERMGEASLEQRFGGKEGLATNRGLMQQFAMQLDLDFPDNGSQADADRKAALTKSALDFLESRPARRLQLAYALPAKTKSQTAADWEAATVDRRIDIARYVLANPDLKSKAEWAEGAGVILDSQATRADVTNLPELTEKQWRSLSDAVVINETQLMVSTTIPGIGNARPEAKDGLKYFDPSFEYLLDLVDSRNPLVKAARELHEKFARPLRGRRLEGDVADKLMSTILNPERLGTWDDRLAENIQQAHSRIDSSGSPQGISQGGLGPQNETTEGLSTRRNTAAVPPDTLRSTVTLSLADLSRDWADGVQYIRPDGTPDMMMFGELNGRFANEVTLEIPGEAPVNVLQLQPYPGLSYPETEGSGFEAVSTERLVRAIERHSGWVASDPAAIKVTVKFLHPADQPAEGFANSVFFEGTVLPNSGDAFISLDAAWWFSAGGIDPNASAQALQSAKKQLKALKAATRVPNNVKKALESGWESDLQAVLTRKAKTLLEADLGDGRRVEPTYFNAVVKRMKMRHLVRGLDADGAVQVLTAEQVVALQRAGQPLGLTNAELYVLSDSALRTMLGESGTRGELRVMTEAPDTDVTAIEQWTGVITPLHISRLPGLVELGAGDLLKTRAARRKFQRKISPVAGLDSITRNSYQRAMILEQQVSTEVGYARAQRNDPKMFERQGVQAIEHASSAFGSQRNLDLARAGRGLPGEGHDASLADLVDKSILAQRQDRLTQQSNMTGWIYRHVLPQQGQRRNGEMYGLASLQQPEGGPERKASWVAPGDFVSIDLDSFPLGTPPAEWKRVLRWYMNAGVTISLTSTNGSPFKAEASQYLRDERYVRIEGSDSLYERENPERVPATLQSRIDRLMETGGKATYNLVSFFQTRHFGLEENTGFVTPAGANRRVVGTVDLIPTGAFENFGLPLPEDMDVIRQRLTLDELGHLEKVSETAAGRSLTKAEKTALRLALEKAENLTDRGLYPSGTELKVGDLIPLYNRQTKQLILYRHGHKPPRNTSDLAAQFKDGNTAIYGAEPLPQATTHSGEIVRFDPANQYGLRVLLKIPLQAWGDKTVVEGNGFKVVSIEMPEGLEIPEGLKGWPIHHVISIPDSASKENFYGRIDNFRNAFTYLGVDFRPTVARFFFGPSFTEAQLSTVPRILESIRRAVPKLPALEVDKLIKAENLAALYRNELSALDLVTQFDGISMDWADKVSTEATPDSRIVRAMVLYLMAEDAQVEHIMYAGGLNNENAKLHGRYTREMPRLFTQVFDRTKMDDPLRTQIIGALNDRFDNENAPYGYTLAPNFTVIITNPNKAHTMEGYLQFAEAQTSGDNPVINLMAQSRLGSQTSSPQQTSMAGLATGSRTSTSKKLDKTAARLRTQQMAAVDSGQELLRLMRAVPQEEFITFDQVKTLAEIEYDKAAGIVRDSLRQPIDMADWDQKDQATYLSLRSDLARKYGLDSAQDELVDYWIRQMLHRRVDERSEEEGGNAGRVSFDSAREMISRMTLNWQDKLLPTTDGEVSLMHSFDLALLWQAAKNGGAFQLRARFGDESVVTSWDDWKRVALAIGEVPKTGFDLLALTAIDGMFHTYRNTGTGWTGLASSLYAERAAQLLDPATTELMMSISPDRAAQLHDVEIVAARATLEDIFGGARVGLAWYGKEPTATAVGQSQRRKWSWARKKDMARPMAQGQKDLLTNGLRVQTETTHSNGFLRGLLNLRAAQALINPMLAIGAPVEQFIQGMLEDATNILAGDATASRIPGASTLNAAARKDYRLLIDAMAHNQHVKTMLFSEFALDDGLNNAGWFEASTHKLAKFGGKMQDPYYKMRANLMVRRYVESATRAFDRLGTATNITAPVLARTLSTDPLWIQKNHPAIHKMAMNTVREMKNMRDTSLSLAWRGILDPMTTSSRLGVSFASTITLKLPFMFAGYTLNKATQVLGLQGADAALALLLHGQKKPKLLGWLQSAVAGRPYADTDEEFDMSSVIESVDLTSAFIKSGVTHSSLMALGLMAGGLGLSGEDEEDRRRRRAARYQGFSYLHDPRDITNDFRNADAIYLDWLPAPFDELFRVTDPNDPSGSRSMAGMNWIMKQIFSPIIGMERFFNTGNPWEIWWGYEDAFRSMPLVSTMIFNDSATIFAELAESALAEEAKGTPESMPKAFNFWVKAVMNLERMLLENSFINMVYQATDQWDRDAWARPERTADGGILRNKIGQPEPSTALQDYVDENGQVAQGYLGREWQDATIHGYAENRFLLALLATGVSRLTGEDGFMRGDMTVKTRTIKKLEITQEEAKAHVLAVAKGLLKKGDPVLETFYIPLNMRQALQDELMAELVAGYKAAGLKDYQATQQMWKVWKGEATNSSGVALKDIVWSKNEFAGLFSYKQSSKYYQQNTTYIMGPDGQMWATGIDKHHLLNLAGMNPLQRYITTEDDSYGVDSRLNTVDKTRGINTGMRGLVKIDESLSIEDPATAAAAAAAEQRAASTWQDYGSNGSGWKNFGRRSGGGGGGGSFTRLNAPQDQQTPYANDVQSINVSNPTIRRSSIRRERIDSQKGRLNPWQ